MKKLLQLNESEEVFQYLDDYFINLFCGHFRERESERDRGLSGLVPQFIPVFICLFLHSFS